MRRKRPYPLDMGIEAALASTLCRLVQPAGHIRLWIKGDDGEVARVPRVVLVDDGEIVPNAFSARGYRE